MSSLHLMLCVFLLSSIGETRPLPQAVLTSSPLQQPAPRKIDPETLKKYVGRYGIDAGIIPVSTLDVTLENGELWVKPSVVKKRRLLHKSKTVFVDEIEGTPLSFNKDEDGKIVSVEFAYEGAKYIAARVTLPPPSLKGNTTFRLKGYADASIVALAGSFNNWNQSQYVLARAGDEWICRIDLEPGEHAYKFIIDGNWLLDPENPNTKDDDYGVKNSVIVVMKNPAP
ncbi:MAG TPA: hypothetical protein VGO56_17465 [Pyrinomonadaceae bacterium]|nr:hypothetical protein [Pyrinomonadaceae bacterium]